MNFILYLTIAAFIFVCLFLILLILIQKGRGGGLSGAFGGSGGNTAFGSKTGDVLTWATSVVFGIFLLLAIALNLLSNHRHALAIQGRSAGMPAPTVPVLPTSPNPLPSSGAPLPPVEAPHGDAPAIPDATPKQPSVAPITPAAPTTH